MKTEITVSHEEILNILADYLNVFPENIQLKVTSTRIDNGDFKTIHSNIVAIATTEEKIE